MSRFVFIFVYVATAQNIYQLCTSDTFLFLVGSTNIMIDIENARYCRFRFYRPLPACFVFAALQQYR